MEKKQFDIFGKPIQEDWEKEWKDMPEFIQEDTEAFRQIIVSFKTKEDVNKLSELIGQKIGPKTKSLWFPQDDREKPSLFKYIIEEDKSDV